jgi:ABC-type polysaccharide transport system permease subunit
MTKIQPIIERSLKKRFLNPRIKLLYTILPLLVFIFIFSYVPLFGWVFSFFDYRPGIPIFAQDFIGLHNFVLVFDKFSGFFRALENTLILNGLWLLVSPLPIVFALLLAEVKSHPLSRIIQTVSSIPNFISWILVYSIFFAIFSNEGYINTILMNLGIIKHPYNVLGDANVAWYFQTVVGIWKSVGWSAIIYIAAMAGIDQELYAAAEVDGANRFRKIWHITIPGILSTYVVLMLLAVSNMLSNSFEQYYVFRNPLVVNKLDVLDIFIYVKGLGSGQFGFATAVGMMRSIISIGLLMFVNYLSKKIRGYSII